MKKENLEIAGSILLAFLGVAAGALLAVLSFYVSWKALRATGVLDKREIGKKDALLIMSQLPPR